MARYFGLLILFYLPFQIFHQFQFGGVAPVPIFQLIMLACAAIKLIVSPRIQFSPLFLIPVVLIGVRIMGDLINLSGISTNLYIKLLFIFVYIYVFNAILKKSQDAVTSALFIAVSISLVYSAYQYLVALLGMDYAPTFAELPVALWNSSAWHTLIIRSGVIRTQGFSYEAAYQTILLGGTLLVYLSVARKVSLKFFFFIIAGIFLSWSRNGVIFMLFMAMAMWGSRKINLLLARGLPFATLTAPIALSLMLNFKGGSYDVSVIARLLPIQLFANSGLQNIVFGVNDYASWIQSVWPVEIRDALYSEKVEEDPKSLVGFLLINFGVVGLVAFAAAQSYLFRNSKKGLIYVSAFNLLVFNVGSIFLPIQWLLYCVAFKAQYDGAAPDPDGPRLIPESHKRSAANSLRRVEE